MIKGGYVPHQQKPRIWLPGLKGGLCLAPRGFQTAGSMLWDVGRLLRHLKKNGMPQDFRCLASTFWVVRTVEYLAQDFGVFGKTC